MAKSQDKAKRETRKPKAEDKVKSKVPAYLGGGAPAASKLAQPKPTAKK